MNNDTNNEINGTVLGSVDNNLNNTNFNNDNNNVSEEVETLDFGPTISENVNQNLGQEQQSTFFTNPPVNDVSVNNIDTPQPNIVNEVPQPMPAYTNPQYINPMPGFENSNNIGITPPISFEKEKKPKKIGSKIIFIILILLAIFGVGAGVYYVLKYTDLIIKEDTITIDVKNIELNIGEELSDNIKDYANIKGTDTNNCSLDKTAVDNTKAGEYDFTVKCGEIEKTGKITIIDNREIIVETKNVQTVKGETIEVTDFIKTIDEALTYEFVEPEVVNNLLANEKGTHKVKIKATNGSKEVIIEGNLTILEYPIRGEIICTSNEHNISELNAVMNISEMFVILNDGNNGFGGITTEVHTFKFNNETDYTNYLATYKTSNNITINNITGDAMFDDNNLTIIIKKERSYEDVINEYGKENMTNYGSIRMYFVNEKKYTCEWAPLASID